MSSNPYDAAASDLFSGNLARGVRSAVVTVQDRNPDTEADVQRKARALGVPYDSARAHPAIVDQRTAGNGVDYDNLARQAPRTSQFLSSTSNAAIAHDDIGILGRIEQGLQSILHPGPSGAAALAGYDAAIGVLGDVQKQGGYMPYLKRVTGEVARNSYRHVIRGIDQVGSGIAGDVESAGEITHIAPLAGLGRAARRRFDQDASNYQTDEQTFTGAAIGQGIESVPISFGALATTIATDGVAPGLALVGATTYGQSYGQARDQGFSVGRATAKSAIDALVEVGTEYLPEKLFLGDSHAGASYGKFLLDQLKSEVPGEQVATLLQDFNQWAMLDRNRGKSFADYTAELVPDAWATLIATGTTMGIAAAPIAATHAGKAIGRVASGPLEYVASALERFNGGALPPEDPQRKAARGQASAEYAPVTAALQTVRRLKDPQAAGQMLQGLYEEHASKRQSLEVQHALALEQQASAKAAYQQALDAQLAAKQNAPADQIAAAEEQAKAASSELSRANLTAAQAALAVQAHAMVEQQIKGSLLLHNQARLDAERRAWNLAKREAAAQQGILAAAHIEDIGKLAAASKLRERNPGPGPTSFHDLVDQMADGSEVSTVHISAETLAAAFQEISGVLA